LLACGLCSMLAADRDHADSRFSLVGVNCKAGVPSKARFSAVLSIKSGAKPLVYATY
jgi:hypothetical protein